MNKAEAQQSLSEGKKLIHRYFDDNEWIRQDGFMMIMEDGASIDTDTFWKDREGIGFETGWAILEDKPKDLIDWIAKDGLPATKSILAELKGINAITIIPKEVESIKRNCEKINEHTWEVYKEQVLGHVEEIEFYLPFIKTTAQEEMFSNMQYYMEHCERNGYCTPQEWLTKHKHF